MERTVASDNRRPVREVNVLDLLRVQSSKIRLVTRALVGIAKDLKHF